MDPKKLTDEKLHAKPTAKKSDNKNNDNDDDEAGPSKRPEQEK